MRIGNRGLAHRAGSGLAKSSAHPDLQRTSPGTFGKTSACVHLSPTPMHRACCAPGPRASTMASLFVRPEWPKVNPIPSPGLPAFARLPLRFDVDALRRVASATSRRTNPSFATASRRLCAVPSIGRFGATPGSMPCSTGRRTARASRRRRSSFMLRAADPPCWRKCWPFSQATSCCPNHRLSMPCCAPTTAIRQWLIGNPLGSPRGSPPGVSAEWERNAPSLPTSTPGTSSSYLCCAAPFRIHHGSSSTAIRWRSSPRIWMHPAGTWCRGSSARRHWPCRWNRRAHAPARNSSRARRAACLRPDSNNAPGTAGSPSITTSCPAADAATALAGLRHHAKRPGEAFEPDRARKREAAGGAVREQVERWAVQPYLALEALRARQSN